MITKRRRKRSCPSERGLEETEKKKGKWKRTGGEERGDTEEKRALPPASQCGEREDRIGFQAVGGACSPLCQHREACLCLTRWEEMPHAEPCGEEAAKHLNVIRSAWSPPHKDI